MFDPKKKKTTFERFERFGEFIPNTILKYIYFFAKERIF